jgi:hypothetical protein
MVIPAMCLSDQIEGFSDQLGGEGNPLGLAEVEPTA